MIEEEKTVVLSLTADEYDNRSKVIADYILFQYQNYGWRSTERKHLKRYQFDANYNRYYVKLKFEKPIL